MIKRLGIVILGLIGFVIIPYLIGDILSYFIRLDINLFFIWLLGLVALMILFIIAMALFIILFYLFEFILTLKDWIVKGNKHED